MISRGVPLSGGSRVMTGDDTHGSAETGTLNSQSMFDSMARSAVHRVRPNGRRLLLRTNDPGD